MRIRTVTKGRTPGSEERPVVRPDDVEVRIADRAYELYQERGRLDSHALEDWLQAEREVLRHNG